MPSSENQVSVVDVSEINQETGDKLIKAASTLGFFFIEGSGFTQKDVDDIFQLSKDFFSLEDSQKSSVLIDQENHGFSKINQELLDTETSKEGDPKEAFNFTMFEDGKSRLPLPDFLQQNSDQIAKLQKKCQDVIQRLLQLLAIGLKIDEDAGGKNWFADRHSYDNRSSILRFLHYPGQKSVDPQQQIRAGAHTDYGSLTLLFQRQGEDGLEILSPITKSWTAVQFLPAKDDISAPPLIVNIADLLSFWTAGVLKSAVHRVRFPAKSQITGQDRYSIAFFSHPNDEILLEPVPSAIVSAITNRGANAPGQKKITARQHLDKRLAATYGWQK